MTKDEFNAKLNLLFAKAKAQEVEIDFDRDDLDPDHLHCLWHHGWVAEIHIGDHMSIAICVYGDVYASLLDDLDNKVCSVADKSNSGQFKDKMAAHIANDQELEDKINSGLLVLENNNWVEYQGVIYRPDRSHNRYGETVDIGLYEDNILDDNILDAIDQVLDNIPTIREQIIKHASFATIQ